MDHDWHGKCALGGAVQLSSSRKIEQNIWLALISLWALLSSSLVWANQIVTLAWNASSATDVCGYKVYYGPASHQYTNSTDVGQITQARVVVPSISGSYYFAVTAYNSLGIQSDFSNEVKFLVPDAARLSLASHESAMLDISVSGSTGFEYVMEVSTNLVDWLPVLTNAPPFSFSVSNTARAPKQFYRAVYR